VLHGQGRTIAGQAAEQAEQPPSAAAAERRLGRSFETMQRYMLPLAWVAVCLVFSLLPKTADTFPTLANFASIFGSQAVVVVLTLGLLVPLTAGDYDLSVAFNLTLSAMILALLNVQLHWSIGLAILAALLVGVVIGSINGLVVTVFRIDPFIVTLGTGTFIGGVVLWISGSNTISGVAPGLTRAVIADRFLGMPLAFYYGLAVCIVVWYVFEFMALGRRLLFVGRGRNVARLSGLRVNRIRVGALIASGLISALAGVLYAGTTGAADPTSGTQLLLPAFAAAFLGATTILPGRFNPWGSIVAVYFLATGITGLQLLGLSGFVQDLFYGGALVAAVALSQLVRRREELTAGTT
jgi:ribose transport system permease protein